MKKLLLLLFALPLFFTYCSDDSKEEEAMLNTLREKIVDTWIVTHYDHRDYGWTAIFNSSYYFTFNGNNTYISNYNITETGTYKFTDAYGGFVLDDVGISFIKFSDDYNTIEWTARDGTDFKMERKKKQ